MSGIKIEPGVPDLPPGRILVEVAPQTRRFPWLGVACAAVAALTLAGVILGGVDRDKRIARAQATADACAAALAKPIPRDPIVYDLATRTEYLRTVLRVLVRETYESGDRVRLPDPPPGWPAITLSSDGPATHTGKRAWREGLR